MLDVEDRFSMASEDAMSDQKKHKRQSAITGRTLNEKWGVGAQHALYRKTGDWYNVLERFPGALFDANGYVLFDTQQEYENCPHLHIGRRLTVRDGIAAIPTYVRVENT
jgi:hypothetical protein